MSAGTMIRRFIKNIEGGLPMLHVLAVRAALRLLRGRTHAAKRALDRIVPISKGDPDAQDNMVLACRTFSHIGRCLPAAVKLKELRYYLRQNAAAYAPWVRGKRGSQRRKQSVLSAILRMAGTPWGSASASSRHRGTCRRASAWPASPGRASPCRRRPRIRTGLPRGAP